MILEPFGVTPYLPVKFYPSTFTGMLNDKNNVYAHNVKGDTIHVSEADSGRKGYFCLGCQQELQAVKAKKSNRIDYFRHDPKNVVNKVKCTYSDETHRHKLAKEIIQRIKRIRVPAVYKYPPKGEDGLAVLLAEAKYIDASHVGIEVTFYEDQHGVVRHGSNAQVDKRFLVVRPDIVFFNQKKEPILFVEIVVTHSLKTEKLVKLKRLKIDTLQIRIPKDSPENIEKNFHTTERSKWIYNHVEENTEYIRPAGSVAAGVSSADEVQRKLYEESFACRAAQVGNLVRAIKRCVDSKPYRDAESALREEISRTERNTESHQSRLDKLREECRSRVKSRFGTEIDKIESEETVLGREEAEFEIEYHGLETRYYSKRSELERAEHQLERRIEKQAGGDTGAGESFENRKREIERDQKRALRDFAAEGRQLEQEEEGVQRDIKAGRARIERVIGARASLPGKFEQLEKRTREGYENLAGREGEEIARMERSTRLEPEILVKSKDELRREFEGLREQSLNTVKARDGEGTSELSRGIKLILQNWGLLVNFENTVADNKRNRKAWDCFKEGTYKNWKE